MAKRYSQANEICQNEQQEPPKPKSKRTTKHPTDEKQQYAEYVRMTEQEYAKLVNSYGEDGAKELITILDDYKGASGKRYKSDYRAILNWCVDKYLKRNNNNQYGGTKTKSDNGAASKPMERNYEEGF